MADEFVDAQRENSNPDIKFVEDYSRAIDTLRFDLLGKEEHSAERLVGADQIITSGVEKMLDFLQQEGFPKQKVAKNLQQTLLYAYFSDEDDLKNQVIQGLVQYPALAGLLNEDEEGGVLDMMSTLYHLADEPTGRDIHGKLAKNIDAFNSYFSGDHVLDAGSFLQTLGVVRGSEDSVRFKNMLKSHVSEIGDQVTPEDLRKSKRAISILGSALTRSDNSDEERKLYRQILFDHAPALIQGIKEETTSFIYDVSSILTSDIPIESRIAMVDQIEAVMPELDAVQQKLVLKQLLHAFQRGSVRLNDYDERVMQTLDKYPDLLWETALATGGFSGIEQYVKYCSEQNRDLIFETVARELKKEKTPEEAGVLLHFLEGQIGERKGNTVKVISILSDNITLLQNVIFDPFGGTSNKSYYEFYKNAVDSVALYGTREQAQPALEMVYHQLSFDPHAFFEEYGLPEDEFIEGWRRGMSDTVMNFEQNREAIAQLASERGKEAVQTLSKDFGIKNFGRYPLELLVRQCDKREEAGAKYGVVLYPEFDHGLAFTSDEDRRVMSDIRSQLPSDYEIRIGEVGSRYELAKRLSMLRQKYGQMGFAIIGAHGDTDMFQMGYGGERKELSVDDLAGTGAERVGDFFEDGATIILESCSTGGEGGIAEKMSNVLGKTVIAPQIVSGGISGITVKERGKQPPQFEIDFYYSAGREYENGLMVKDRPGVDDD